MKRILTIDLSAELDRYFNDSSLARNCQPEFILIMGPVGAGKTSLRHEQYHTGYVNLDAAEIYLSLAKDTGYKFPTVFNEPLNWLGHQIAIKAIKEKRHIVTEVVGDTLEDLKAIGNALNSVGYKTRVVFVECDPDLAYQRHRHALETESNYVSAFYTQTFHINWLLETVEQVVGEISAKH